MKNKIWIRMFTVLMAALMMMGGLSVVCFALASDCDGEEVTIK